jgi:hypothetical protein
LIQQAESQINAIRGDLKRIAKMKQVYTNEIAVSDIFEQWEKDEYLSSLQFHVKTHRDAISNIVRSINSAKELWNQKMMIMDKYWKSGILDDGVIEKWKQSMDVYETKIEQLDRLLSEYTS